MNAKTKEEYDRAIEELKKVSLIGNDYDGAQEAFSKIRDIVFCMVKGIEEEKVTASKLNELVLEVNCGFVEEDTSIVLGNGATVLFTPPVGENYWLFRVKVSTSRLLSDSQSSRPLV